VTTADCTIRDVKVTNGGFSEQLEALADPTEIFGVRFQIVDEGDDEHLRTFNVKCGIVAIDFAAFSDYGRAARASTIRPSHDYLQSGASWSGASSR
jgi:hypothetical protein